MSDWAEILVGALGGSGLTAIAGVITAKIRAQRGERRDLSDLVGEMVSAINTALREEREVTGKHRIGHLECLEKVAEVREELGHRVEQIAQLSEDLNAIRCAHDELRKEHEELRAEHSECPMKIERLEREVEALRAELDASKDQKTTALAAVNAR